MEESILYKDYFDLSSKLYDELIFIIPRDVIPPDYSTKLDKLEELEWIDTVLIIDHYEGPIKWREDRNNVYFFGKSGRLEKNIFQLIEKKETLSKDAFGYLIKKYTEQAKTIHLLTQWLTDYIEKGNFDQNLVSIFKMQCRFLEYHMTQLNQHFSVLYEENRMNNVDAIKFIKAFAEGQKASKSNKHDSVVAVNIVEPSSQKAIKKKREKRILITEEEAELELLQKVFKINI
ncbi:hypothetical protein LRR18_11925 [Mangrovimonas sp. AS39]|uniref:hypothetical protein n=1 Tax=Mangrovimonas futianensis TaxID=2895523 RepID=UPI001E549AB4|nr:hypothetical protein [Mangrovimonas futianensis]MCF1192294.1 hypothetical protein [Mangrovimonas futianensis]MCF1195957.1 hypothetical protein [Mangrovimonas futianensis]MCF1422985.1 hypothetical protein [Mangrovimonas futianensis]